MKDADVAANMIGGFLQNLFSPPGTGQFGKQAEQEAGQEYWPELTEIVSIVEIAEGINTMKPGNWSDKY